MPYNVPMQRFLLLMALILIAFSPVAARGGDPRSDFLALIDRPRVPLAAEISALPDQDDLLEYHFTYAADATHRVPGILVMGKSAVGRRPVVIALHGTGGNKSDEVPFLREVAARGFIGVAIDGRYHGERSKAGRGTDDYEAAILKAWREGGHGVPSEHPFYFDTVWDISRLIDYLDSRADVDPNRIGLYGVSKGGIETYLTAAVDPRVAVAVPCIGLESFSWALDNNDWQGRIGTIQHAFDAAAKEAGLAHPGTEFVRQFYARVVPGIDSEFDGPEMVKLISPRPLMAINGDIDPHTPLPGLRLCIASALDAYRAAGASDHFAIRIQRNTAHKVNADSHAAAIDWFAKWLKP